MHTLPPFVAVIRTAFLRIFSSPLAGLLNILVIGIALSLPAGMYILLQNAQSLVDEISGPQQISIFLQQDASTLEIEHLQKLLSQNEAISSVKFISRADALEGLKQSTGLSDVIAGLETNPLPDAFIVTPKSRDASYLENLRTSLVNLPKVAQAQHDTSWAYKLEAILKFARIAILILASLLSVALIAITFNTIRLQILTQRDEILVSKLIGATNGFIRRPFLYFGALQGLLGGLAAWLIISVSLHMLQSPLNNLSLLYSSNFSLHSLSVGDTLSLLLFSLYLGLLGAWLSVSRHLTAIEPR
ncbi:MAG: permease-like cell division protein FtsX [Gallionella sp.]|nr:permease-like cell division protein FtsX [Gallionella sp.]MDD4945909.1 permease-like cell division protein FtsX [Gallionella sp.]MDD5611435.1 permease-like cell division protein FtsX [Gallionella sp.]